MVEPEDYEFVEPMLDKGPLQPIFNIDYKNDFERDLHVHSALVPLYLSRELDQDSNNLFESRELTGSIATFYDRSRIYHSLFNNWMSWNLDGRQVPYATKRAGAHIFAPIYAQELEGPMKYHIATLIHLLDEYRGSEGNWHSRLYDSDGDIRRFHEMLNTCIQISEQAHNTADNGELNAGIELVTKGLIIISQHQSYAERNGLGESFDEALDSGEFDEHPNASDIRNSFSHADYRLVFEDAFELDEENINLGVGNSDIVRPIDSIISYIHRQMSLMYSFITGVTLGLYHISISEEYDDQIGVLWNVLPGQVSEENIKKI